jgi:hypothetical protein
MNMSIEEFVNRSAKAQKAVDKILEEFVSPKKPTPSELEAAATAERETWEQCQMLLNEIKKAGNKLAVLLLKKEPVDKDEVLAALKEWDALQ